MSEESRSVNTSKKHTYNSLNHLEDSGAAQQGLYFLLFTIGSDGKVIDFELRDPYKIRKEQLNKHMPQWFEK